MSARRLIPLLAAVALLAPAAPAAAQDPTTLVVVETADVRATPDTAEVGAAIRRADRSAARARRRVERALAAKLRRLAALGVPRADVRTESISSFRTRRNGRTVYRASTSLRIRTTDLARLPAILPRSGAPTSTGPSSASPTAPSRGRRRRASRSSAPAAAPTPPRRRSACG